MCKLLSLCHHLLEDLRVGLESVQGLDGLVVGAEAVVDGGGHVAAGGQERGLQLQGEVVPE